MPFGRRRLSREIDQQEQQAKDAARELIARISVCFVSDPDLYDVKAAVITKGEQADLLLVRLAWSDEDRNDYFLEGNPWAVVRDVLEVANDAAGREKAEAWIGESIREVPFKLLPGLFQEAYVAAVVDPRPPPDPLGYWWIVPAASDHWPVRLFPSGIGEKAPPIGEIGYVLVPRAAIEEMWRVRGW